MTNTHVNPLIDTILQSHTQLPNTPAPSGIVRVVVKTHYGTKHFYADNAPARLFLSIQGGKTLTPDSLKILKQHGYEIEYRYEEVKL